MKRQPNEIPASLKNINLKAILRRSGVYVKQKRNNELKEAAIPMARQMLTKKKSVKTEKQRYVNFSNEEAIAYAEKQIHIIHVIEEKFDNKVAQFITKVVNGFLAHLESEIATTKKVKAFKTKDWFDDNESDYMEMAQLDFTPLLIDQAVLAGTEALKLIKSKDLYTPYKYRQTIADNVAKFTQSMLDTDRQKLIDIIDSAVKDGKTIPEIRSIITADFDTYTKSQADRVARTEVARVTSQASLDAWEQSGLVEGKQWVVMEGGDECDAYDGQIEALDGNFYGDTTEFADGDPPIHPNCKCQLIPILLNE